MHGYHEGLQRRVENRAAEVRVPTTSRNSQPISAALTHLWSAGQIRLAACP